MALRVRIDGRILCAAMHPIEPGDKYLDDGEHYELTVERGLLVTEPMRLDGGRGGHGKHGQWWWHDGVPDDVVADDFYAARRSA